MWLPPDERFEPRASVLGREAAPILLWCDHTAAIARPTGVQRVVRGLARELGAVATPIGWDRWRRSIRPLSFEERWALGVTAAPANGPLPQGDSWLLIAETPTTAIADGVDPIIAAHGYGFRAAVLVHDLIPVLKPESYVPEVAAWYRAFFRSLAAADLLFATTRHVAKQLRGFFASEGLRLPPVAVVPLAAELPGTQRVVAPPPPRERGIPLELLTVSRLEPRKNLPRLLRAIERVRAGGRDVRLTLVGRRGGFPGHEDMIDALLARMPWVTAPSDVFDPVLCALYASHHAAIYPSLEEGFGLPVLESLWLGRPCLVHDGSAMAEVAPGGGTLSLDMGDEAVLAYALARVFDEPALAAALAAEATKRPLRSWAELASEVRDALETADRRRVGAGASAG